METLANPSRALDAAKLGASSAATLGRLLLLPPDPETPFKGALGVRKMCAWSQPIALADVKSIGKVTGGTVNDVLLTAVSGALGRYLHTRGEPAGGLDFRAVVPVNLRPIDEKPKLGNAFGLVFLSLPVGIADPLDRLFELKTRMDGIKGTPEAIVSFGVLGMMGVSVSQVQDVVLNIFGSKATAVMTNVPGPREVRYFAGKPIDGIMFWVPQSGKLGLGVSIMSYNNEVLLGIATDAGLVPDPETIIAGFHKEFEEMMGLVEAAREMDVGTADTYTR
jgi:WS/DGAT/MGAT family acyltransferase